MARVSTVFTIGHSNRSIEELIALLRQNGITAVADVRSQPYSRLYPQFNRDPLEDSLKRAGIQYIFLGKELGARSEDTRCYDNGRVRYGRLAETALFQHGLDRIHAGLAKGYTIAILCAEKEPLDCHRTILVARQLAARGFEIKHIVGEKLVEDHRETIERLRHGLSLGSMHLFKGEDELVAIAYEMQEEKIAFTKTEEEHR